MMRAKITVLLAVVLTFTTMVASGAEHKSYVNDRYAFGFDYPATWTLIEAEPGATLLKLKLLSPDENVPVRRDRSPGSVSIEVFANPNRQPLREWLDEHGWPFAANGRSVTPTSIGGLPALEVATGQMFAPNRFTYVANKTWVLRVSALASGSETVVQSIRFNP